MEKSWFTLREFPIIFLKIVLSTLILRKNQHPLLTPLRTLSSPSIEFADETLRTLLLTYREGTNETAATLPEDIQNNLIIIGMVGIKDPIREAISHAVQLCFKAVKVRMIPRNSSCYC